MLHAEAFQVTLVAFHVTAPTIGGVKFAAFARMESRSCLLALARTMLSIVTVAGAATVATDTLVTANAMFAGTVIRHCSPTVAVRVEV